MLVARLSGMNPSGSAGGGERRADRRYKVNFRVNIMREESPEVEGEVTDLSVGGTDVMKAIPGR
jgi:hypothetical protein